VRLYTEVGKEEKGNGRGRVSGYSLAKPRTPPTAFLLSGSGSLFPSAPFCSALDRQRPAFSFSHSSPPPCDPNAAVAFQVIPVVDPPDPLVSFASFLGCEQ